MSGPQWTSPRLFGFKPLVPGVDVSKERYFVDPRDILEPA